MEHNKLNIKRKSKGVKGGFFLDIWICVNGVANCNCCILAKVRYAATIKREGRKRGEALSSKIKLGFMNIIYWH